MDGIYDFGAALEHIRAKLKPLGKLGVVRWDDITDWALEDLRLNGMIRIDEEGVRLRAPAYLAFEQVVKSGLEPHPRWILRQVTQAHLVADPRYAKLRDEAIKEMHLSFHGDGEPTMTPTLQRLSDEMRKIDWVVA